MITTTVLLRAAVIAAAMLVALGLLDVIHERFSSRGARFVADFGVLIGYMLTLQRLLG
jgi:hypothetical protein